MVKITSPRLFALCRVTASLCSFRLLFQWFDYLNETRIYMALIMVLFWKGFSTKIPHSWKCVKLSVDCHFTHSSWFLGRDGITFIIWWTLFNKLLGIIIKSLQHSVATWLDFLMLCYMDGPHNRPKKPKSHWAFIRWWPSHH